MGCGAQNDEDDRFAKNTVRLSRPRRTIMRSRLHRRFRIKVNLRKAGLNNDANKIFYVLRFKFDPDE
jgi:hypothetical protein